MAKFSVVVNDSSKHVVSARSPLGALKVALASIEEDEPKSLKGESLEISIRSLGKPAPDVSA